MSNTSNTNVTLLTGRLQLGDSALIIQASTTAASDPAALVITTSGNNITLSGKAGGTVSVNGSSTAPVQNVGNATLVAGTVTVANTAVTASSELFLSRKTIGGTTGTLSYTVSAGVGFTITSSSNTDTSVISWLRIN